MKIYATPKKMTGLQGYVSPSVSDGCGAHMQRHSSVSFKEPTMKPQALFPARHFRLRQCLSLYCYW